MNPDREYYMGLAIEEAKKAEALGEAPVGAVIVKDGEVISAAHNRRETGKNALYHAELIAIDAACKKLKGWRLFACDLYVTLEPCPMCAGAIINARIKTLVYGAKDPKAGCFGSMADFNAFAFNHRPEVLPDVRAVECAALLSGFFAKLRQK